MIPFHYLNRSSVAHSSEGVVGAYAAAVHVGYVVISALELFKRFAPDGCRRGREEDLLLLMHGEI